MRVKKKGYIAALSIATISISLIGVGLASWQSEDYVQSNEFTYSVGTIEYLTNYVDFGSMSGFVFGTYGVYVDETFIDYGSVNFQFAIKLKNGLNAAYSMQLGGIQLQIDLTSTNSSVNLLNYYSSNNGATLYYGYDSYENASNSQSLSATVSGSTLSTIASVELDSTYLTNEYEYIYFNLEVNLDFSSSDFENDVYNNLITDNGMYFTLAVGVLSVYEA